TTTARPRATGNRPASPVASVITRLVRRQSLARADAREISHSRYRTQLIQRGETAWIVAQPDDLARWIGERPEHDGAGRARLLARGHDRPRMRLVRQLRVYLRRANALNAERALLHHSTRADSYFRVLYHPLRFRNLPVVVEPVESPYLVRTIVGAEPRADATVVHHFIETVVAVYRRVDRAYVLARSLLALLTQHRLNRYFRLLRGSFDVAIDAHPVHLSALEHPVTSHDGNVVLCLACDDACAASGTRVEIDHHCPLIGSEPIRAGRRRLVQGQRAPFSCWRGGRRGFRV